MERRLELHEMLKEALGSDYVYFQPPPSVRMSYPCIVYAVDGMGAKRADNKLYVGQRRYSVTVIDKDPDSLIVNRMLYLPLCEFDRFYTADNLNHWVFRLYF